MYLRLQLEEIVTAHRLFPYLPTPQQKGTLKRDGAFAVHWNILCFPVWPARAQPKPMSAKIALKKAHGDNNEDRKLNRIGQLCWREMIFHRYIFMTIYIDIQINVFDLAAPAVQVYNTVEYMLTSNLIL